MSDQLDEPRIKNAPIGHLKVERGAEDLLDSPAMEPYIRLALAMETGQDLSGAMTEISTLPLESRYIWRVSSALKWAFADFDTVPVRADMKTMCAEDRNQLVDLLEHRPLQFCLFLSALFGQRQMEVLMVSAIKQSREVVRVSQAGSAGTLPSLADLTTTTPGALYGYSRGAEACGPQQGGKLTGDVGDFGWSVVAPAPSDPLPMF